MPGTDMVHCHTAQVARDTLSFKKFPTSTIQRSLKKMRRNAFR